jgi:hypothetical protein
MCKDTVAPDLGALEEQRKTARAENKGQTRESWNDKLHAKET